MGADILSPESSESSASHAFCYLKDVKLRHMDCSCGHMLVCVKQRKCNEEKKGFYHPPGQHLLFITTHEKIVLSQAVEK